MQTDYISQYENQIGISIEVLVENIRSIINNTIPYQMTWRIKNINTIQKKIALKNGTDVFALDDVYGVRILVPSIDEAYSLLQKILNVIPGHVDHDFLVKPKISSKKPGARLRLLQSIHYINNVPFEIQITTTDFHKENESHHEEYHKNKYKAL